MKNIGPYRIIKPLGKGGMADVYLGIDPNLGRQVAVKVLSDELSGDPEFQANFVKEAKIIANLEHAAIVPVYDFSKANKPLYLVMRHMTGGSLREELKKGKMPLDKINSVLKQLARALDYVHQKGILHRDIKPGNILFDAQAHAYLSDFGIAHSITSGYATIAGTRAFMSPEQLAGETLDARSDIYSLAVTLFNMLTGHLDFSDQHSLRPHRANLSPDIEHVLDRALAKKKEARYATAEELADAFNQVVKNSKEGFRLPLVNRDFEKKMIRELLEDNFYVQIYAPSGLGKTYLMQEIKRELRAERWHTIWIEFKGKHKEYVANRFTFLDFIYRELDDTTPPSMLDENQLLKEIGLALAKISTPVVLFIDDADAAVSKILKWIRQTFLHTLTQNLSIEGIEGKKRSLHVLAAGEQVILEWQGYKRGPQFKKLKIYEFKEKYIFEEIIDQVILRSDDRQIQAVRAVGGRAWETYLEEMANGLLDISCGHALVITEILHYVVKQNWLADRTCFIQHRHQLCERCLAPIVDGHILFSLDRVSREALRSICIFRYIWPSLIRELTDDEVSEELGGSWEPFSEGRRSWSRWWSGLEETHLVELDDERSIFRLSPVVRQVVSIVLHAENEPLFRARHRRAQQIYQPLLTESMLPPLQRAAYMFEYFYHTVQAGSFTQTELTTELTHTLTHFLKSLNKRDVLDMGFQFLQWFQNDTELDHVVGKAAPGLYHQLGRQAYDFIQQAKQHI